MESKTNRPTGPDHIQDDVEQTDNPPIIAPPTGRFACEVCETAIVILHESTCQHYQRLPYPIIYVPADTLDRAERRCRQLTIAIAKLPTAELRVAQLRELHAIVVTEKPHDSKWMESPRPKRKQTKHNTLRKAARVEKPKGDRNKQEAHDYRVALSETRTGYVAPPTIAPPINNHRTIQEQIKKPFSIGREITRAIARGELDKPETTETPKPRRVARKLIAENVPPDDALAFCVLARERGVKAECTVNMADQTNNVFILGGIRSKAAKELLTALG